MTPFRVEDLTSVWIEGALHGSGALAPTSHVLDVRATAVGDRGGVNGDAFRLALAYEGVPGPTRLIAKFGTPGVRGVAVFQGWYEREVRFYQQFAPRTPLRTPRAHAVALGGPGECVLLLEDLAPFAQGDQELSCTPEQALATARALGEHHAAWWGSAEVEAAEWLPDTTVGLTRAARVAGAFARALETAGPLLTPRLRDVRGRLSEAYVPLLEAIAQPPRTLTHGDFRLDNLFFSAAAPVEVAAIDWQFACRTRGAYDLAYFLGLDLEPSVRAAVEGPCIEAYLEALTENGVTYERRQFERDYDISLLASLAVFTIGAGSPSPNPRMDRVHAQGIERLGAAIEARDALKALDRLG
ncbi:MAG: hypothetical protein EPO65_12670 [Dehalococcoidia bacterium]|nr:MAG: hypothetical protein EPO65_12670 [Dehalococcoidia bacterium]